MSVGVDPSEQGSVEAVWCPFCSRRMGVAPAEDPASEVRCPRCGGTARLEHVLAASRWRTHAAQLDDYVAGLRGQAQALLEQASRVEADAMRARSMAQRAWLAARRGAGAGTRPTGQPPTAAATTRRAVVPVSVLLQGTGALLLLAALMIGSAVLWGSLPPWSQAALLIGLVGTVGLIAVWLGRRLPATGAVLSVLAAAAGAVVASALPRVLDGLDGRWYPVAASAVGAFTLLLLGRTLRVRLWWHAGVLLAAMSAGLAINATIASWDLEPLSVRWFAAAVVLTLPLAGAALAASRAAATAGDAETAATTGVIGAGGLAVSVAGVLAALVSWLRVLEAADVTVADRAALAGAAAATAALLSWTSRRWTGNPAPAWAGAGVLGMIPVVLTMPNAPITPTGALVCTAVPLALLSGAAALAVRRPSARGAVAAAVVSLVTVAALALSAAGSTGDYGWLVALLWGTGAAVVGAGYALATRGRPWLLASATLFAVTWVGVWTTGQLGGPVESLVLPIGGFLIVLRLLAGRRRLLPQWLAGPVAGQVLLLATVAPSAVTAWLDQSDGTVPAARLALVAAGLLAVAMWSALARSGWTVPVLGIAVVAVGHTWVALLQRTGAPPEAFGAAVALAVLAVLLAGAADGWATGRVAVHSALAIAVLPSVLLLIAEPAWDPAVGLRLLWATGILTVLLVLQWQRPTVAWLIGSAACALPLWVYEVWAVTLDTELLEILTAPAAVAAGLSAALSARALPDWPPLRVGVRVGFWLLVAPPLVLVLGHLDPSSTVQAMRLLVVLAVFAVLAVAGDRRARLESALAAWVVVVIGWLQVLRVAVAGGWLLEGFTLPSALAATLLAGWVLRPATVGAWWRVGRWPALAALTVSTGWALTGGLLPSALWTDWVRAGILVVAWTASMWLAWSSVWLAAGCGTAAVAVVAADTVSLLVAGRTDPALEMLTWPAAAALGAVAWLVWRAAGRRGPSLLWVGPPVALALLPTAALAWADGTAGWRAWFGLLVGAAVLAGGVRVAWAGLVVPGVLSVALVAVPVVLRVAGEAPVWVPMTIAGALLIVVGARLEATRREGHRLIDWAVHLH